MTITRIFWRQPRLTAAAAILIVLVLSARVLAQPPDPPPFYAIQDARVVTGNGDDIERATVLIADGLIEAVGQDLEIPADALVLDGSGLTVFAGLFDGLSNLGIVQDQPPAGGRGGGPGGRDSGPTIRGPQDRPATTPWKNPADDLKPSDSRIAKWREAGFTHALTAPQDGLFAGLGSVIALAGDEPSSLVLRSGAAQRLNMRATGGFRNFPGSLMGVLSYLRQVFLDTQHYGEAKAMYAEDPRGLDRPAYDRTLDPLLLAMENRTPFLMPADRGRHIDRALILADDFDLNVVLYGAQGAYERAETLSATKTPVLVSLDWPEEGKDRAPDAETSFRDLAHRRLAPAVPGQLAAAGVSFGFTSAGKSGSDALKAVRAAVDAGLSNEDALAALTTAPAEMFGVADQLGTVEAGKIANLVLASDFPWADGAEIKAVFVDGRRFAERESNEESLPPEVDPSGTWSINLTTPRGESELTAELSMSPDGKLTGEVSGERGTMEIEDGKVEGDRLSFKTTQSMGPRTMEANYSGFVSGENLTGTLSAGPMTMEFAGERTAIASATEATTESEEGEEPAVSLTEIRDAWTVFQGPVDTDDSFAITNATIHTVSGGVIEGGTVVVRNGKIRAVGANARVPRGTRTIDATGKHVIPGIIDAHSHLGIEGGTNEGSLAVTAMVGIDDVVDPDDIGIYRALAGGVTAANVLHGSANPIGGRNQVIKLRWGSDAETMKMKEAAPGIKFALGENPKRSRSFPGSDQRYPTTRMGVIDVIRDAFIEARAYQTAWAEHKAAGSRGQRSIPPRKDLKLQTLAEILDGKRQVHTHSYRADEILQMLRVAEEFGFTVATLQHVLEGYKVADEIAKHGAGASTFSDWWGYKVEAYDAIPHNAALMAERGVLVSINSDSNEEIRHLNHEAAKAVRWGGMSDNEALALVTLNPAKQLNIDEVTGSIDVGKHADLVIYDGHPLSVHSVVEKTFIDGVLYFDLEADRERQQLLMDIKSRMEGKADGEEESDDADTSSMTTPRTSPDPDRSLMSADIFAGAGEGTYSCREVHYQ